MRCELVRLTAVGEKLTRWRLVCCSERAAKSVGQRKCSHSVCSAHTAERVHVGHECELLASARPPTLTHPRVVQLAIIVYIRPRFLGSVRTHSVATLNAFDDIVRMRDEQTPGTDRDFKLVSRVPEDDGESTGGDSP